MLAVTIFFAAFITAMSFLRTLLTSRGHEDRNSVQTIRISSSYDLVETSFVLGALVVITLPSGPFYIDLNMLVSITHQLSQIDN
jgi:hypothetical protein